MSGAEIVKAYRLAVRLYPKSFRDEYGDDLVQLLTSQLRDERTVRVLARTATDLLLSLPQRHLESHMHATRSSTLPVAFGAAALSALVVGIVVGHPAVIAGCVASGIGLGALALLAAHRNRPLSDGHPTSSRWWVVLSAGVLLLVTLIALTTATGELPSGGWLIAMIVGLTSVLLIAAGLILAIVHLASYRRRSVATP